MKMFKMMKFSLIVIVVCASGVGVKAAINDPGDVTGLSLYLVANDLGLADGDPVTNWTDRVGSNDFFVYQSIPTLVADGARGTNDAVRFLGATGSTLANTNLSVGTTHTSNMTLFVSARFTSFKTSSDGFLVGSQFPSSSSDGRCRIYSESDDSTLGARMGDGGAFNTGAPQDLAYHVFALVSGQVTNEVTLRLDGAVLGSGVNIGSGTPQPWVAFSLAGNPRNGGNGADCEIAEVVAYDRALNETEIADVTAYLTDRNTPVANPTNLLFTQTYPLLTSAPIGTEIGQFTTESEVPGTFTYDLVPGAGDTNNASFNVASDRLQTAAAAAAGDFQFRAESRNVGDTNLFLEAAFTVTAEVDSDLDGLADDWELLYAPNLDVLDGDGVADSDSDGLTDLEEYVLLFTDAWAVDPTDPDSDEDDLLDGDEVNGTGARPVTNPTSDDTDGDTLKDGVESNTRVFVDAFDTGTDPTDKDTDDDTLFDNIELNTGVFVSTNNPGTSPLTPDSDLDGLTDAEELVLAVAFGGPTDPNDWDSDDDTAGDGLEYNVFFSDPNNPASVPLFNWPTPKGTFAGIPASYSIGAATPNVAVDELLGGFFVELKVGEQLRASFDITAQQVGNADNLDLRVGFGSTSACTFPGYMNPTTDLGPPAGTTATLRFRNDSFDWGSNQQNTTLENSSQVPANGGVTGVGNANSVSFTLVRTDLGYYSVFQWEEIVLESPITPVQYYSNPLWERVFVRLQRSNANDLFEVSNLQVTYEDATPPYIRPIVLSDLTPGPGPSLSFSFLTDLGSSGYVLQATSDLTAPASWADLLTGIPTGGATSTVSSVEVPGGDLTSTQRHYRVVYP